MKRRLSSVFASELAYLRRWHTGIFLLPSSFSYTLCCCTLLLPLCQKKGESRCHAGV